jgi:uncharacterized protein YcbX
MSGGQPESTVGFPITALRRYPVKAMGGEALRSVPLDRRGLHGDRWFAVEDDEGNLASGKDTRRFRRRDAVFAYQASTSPDGVVVVGPSGSWAVGNPALDAELSTALGVRVRVAPEAEVPHQDAGAVSIIGSATLRWCAERWGINADPRRLRSNVVFGSDEPFIEETWIGHDLRVGSATLTVVERVPRCRMIDIAQDGTSPVGRWVKPLAAERGMNLAVYAEVMRPGLVTIDDAITVM